MLRWKAYLHASFIVGFGFISTSATKIAVTYQISLTQAIRTNLQRALVVPGLP